jgi:hypothetical protein
MRSKPRRALRVLMRRRARKRCYTRSRRRTGDGKRERQAPSTGDHAGITICKIYNIQTPQAVGVCPAECRRKSGAISPSWSRIAICCPGPRPRETVVRIVRGRLVSSCSPDSSRRQLRGSSVAKRVDEIRHCPITGAVLYKQSSAPWSYQHNPNIVRKSMR